MKFHLQLCLLVALSLSISAFAAPVVNGTQTWGAEQRELNDSAACFDLIRHSIIDSKLNHQPGENLVSYLSSLTNSLPKESNANYDKRFEGYIKLLNIAQHKLKIIKIPTVLSDKSAKNIASWQHVKNVIHDLPIQIKRLNIAWKLLLSDHKKMDPKLFVTTIQTCLAGYEALRDVRQ